MQTAWINMHRLPNRRLGVEHQICKSALAGVVELLTLVSPAPAPSWRGAKRPNRVRILMRAIWYLTKHVPFRKTATSGKGGNIPRVVA